MTVCKVAVLQCAFPRLFGLLIVESQDQALQQTVWQCQMWHMVWHACPVCTSWRQMPLSLCRSYKPPARMLVPAGLWHAASLTLLLTQHLLPGYYDEPFLQGSVAAWHICQQLEVATGMCLAG